MSLSEPSPVSGLSTLGAPKLNDWPDYVAEYGLTPADVPELLRLAVNTSWEDWKRRGSAAWAPVHARRALGQLGAPEAVGPLIKLLDGLDESDDEWLRDEVPKVLAMIGPGTLSLLQEYLADGSHGTWARVGAATGIEKLVDYHSEARAECVAVLTRQLERAADEDVTLNACIICSLIELKATESLPVIHEAYRGDNVDELVCGDYLDVEVDMGVREPEAPPEGVSPAWSPPRVFDPVTPVRIADRARTGRNEPCPCGSGLKFKKCCLGRSPQAAS